MKRSLITIGTLALTAIVLVSVLASGINVTTSDGKLGLSIGRVQAAELSGWTIKFNPTGTSIKDGYLKIRLDFYPSETSKSYATFYVDIQDRFPTEKELADLKLFALIPTHKVLNPAICMFVTVPENITAEQLTDYITRTYTADCIATVDNVITEVNASHLLRSYLADKLAVSKQAVVSKETGVIAAVNTRLAGLALTGSGTGIPENLLSGSIDIGAGAGDLGSQTEVAPGGESHVDLTNPANATGNIDTFQINLRSWGGNMANCKMGTFSGSAAIWTNRDYVSLGTITAGSTQTFTGQTCDVVTDDIIGVFGNTSGYLIYAATGGSNVGIKAADVFTGSAVTFTIQTSWRVALYGTGTESGGDPSLVNTPNTLNLGTLWQNGTYYAKGNAPSNPVETGNCTFLIINNGSITENITVSMTNMTGGTTWTITSSAPGLNTFRMTAYYAGQNPASGVVLLTSAQPFYNGLAASANISWDFKYETGTWADGDTTQRTGTLQLTAISP